MEPKENLTGLRVVFMGTPQFAKFMLEGLLHSRHKVVGVVTVADKPAGRGQLLKESEVKQTAKAFSLPVLQPQSLKDPAFITDLQAMNAEVFVVVAFRMLPEVVWRIPPKGTINLHASLLPNYRGAAPIQWAIINGECTTGLTTFFINQQIDCGAILMQHEIPIQEHWTGGDLHDALLKPGSTLILETLEALDRSALQGKPQDLSMNLKEAPKLTKSNTRVNFNEVGEKIHGLVRALHPYPSAYCTLLDKNSSKEVHCKILKGFPMAGHSATSTTLQSTKEGILFPCKDGYYCVQVLQLEGKRAMDYKAFLAGNDANQYMIV